MLISADLENVEVYFGVGCFWHVQHEFVEAERKILGRNDMQITSRAGYAGGKAGAKNGKVCYHNALQVSEQHNWVLLLPRTEGGGAIVVC